MPEHSGAVVRIAADVILMLHGLWVVFLVGGVMVVRGHPWAERVHVGGLVFNLVLDLTGLPCPLTVAETARLLRCNPPCAYQGSCITNYLAGLFPVVAWPGVQAWFGVLLLGVALWRYGFLGGRLARYMAAGVHVGLITATRGEAGGGGDPFLTGAARERELRRAVRALGIRTLRILGYQDGHLARTDRPLLVSRLVGVLRELRPHVVITFGPDGISGHPDHVALGEATTEAFSLAGRAVYSSGPTSGELKPHHPLRLFHIVPSPATRQCCRKGTGEFTASGLTAVDVAAFREVKVRAMQCHASQDQPFPGDPGAEAGRLHEREYFRLVWPATAEPPATDLFEGLP